MPPRKFNKKTARRFHLRSAPLLSEDQGQKAYLEEFVPKSLLKDREAAEKRDEQLNAPLPGVSEDIDVFLTGDKASKIKNKTQNKEGFDIYGQEYDSEDDDFDEDEDWEEDSEEEEGEAKKPVVSVSDFFLSS